MKRCALNRFWMLIRRFHGDSITVYAVRGRVVSTCPVCRESLLPGAPGFVDAPPPYPRSPLREFTPCAPGRSNPFYSLLIAHRLIVFASNHIHGAEAVTGPVLWCRFTGGDHVPQTAAQGKADFFKPRGKSRDYGVAIG